MEPEITLFLKKILWTLSTLLLWMMVNILFGLKWEYAIPAAERALGSAIFYGWMLISLFFLFKLYKKYWGNSPQEIAEGEK